uniref:Uncharacterized protein n=1 Tax=Panagrolaimus sp. JU765 TaxID=591449 RepID=A0AC34RQP2_9BILA
MTETKVSSVGDVCRSLPHLQALDFDNILPDKWEKSLCSIRTGGVMPNLEVMKVQARSLDNPQYLKEFLFSEPKKILILSEEPVYDEKKLLKYFKPVEK